MSGTAPDYEFVEFLDKEIHVKNTMVQDVVADDEEEEIDESLIHVKISIAQNDDELEAVNMRFYTKDDIRFVYEKTYDKDAFDAIKQEQDLEIDFQDFPNVIQEVLNSVGDNSENPENYVAEMSTEDEGMSNITLSIKQELDFCATEIFVFTLPRCEVEIIEKVSQARFNEITKEYDAVRQQYKDLVKRIGRQSPEILKSFKITADMQ